MRALIRQMSTENLLWGAPRIHGELLRREPAIELDEEPAVVVREASPAFQLASQDDQLMSKHCILRIKPDVSNGEASTARTKQISAIIAPT